MGLLVLLCASVLAQNRPAFDVASVKASPPPVGQNININLGTVRDAELSLGNATLSECVRFAYGLVSEDQVSGPSWIKDREVRFDILAKSSPGTPRERMLLMLQTLLDERFRIATHREQRRVSHYALVVVKSGPKMQRVEPNLTGARQSYGTGRIYHSQIRMGTLAMLLSRQLRETVLDQTGLSSAYDVKLDWDAEEGGSGPSLFTALQEQLGLRLESSKDPIEILVIDRAERVPIAN